MDYKSARKYHVINGHANDEYKKIYIYKLN